MQCNIAESYNCGQSIADCILTIVVASIKFRLYMIVAVRWTRQACHLYDVFVLFVSCRAIVINDNLLRSSQQNMQYCNWWLFLYRDVGLCPWNWITTPKPSMLVIPRLYTTDSATTFEYKSIYRSERDNVMNKMTLNVSRIGPVWLVWRVRLTLALCPVETFDDV